MSGTAFRHCNNCGGDYFDHRHESEIQWKIVLCCPIWFLLYLLYAALTIVLAVVSCGCGCMCQGGTALDFEPVDGKRRGNCCDLLRCIGQGLFGPLIQACMFFPSLHCCMKCFFLQSQLEGMGFQ